MLRSLRRLIAADVGSDFIIILSELWLHLDARCLRLILGFDGVEKILCQSGTFIRHLSLIEVVTLGIATASRLSTAFWRVEPGGGCCHLFHA